MTAAERHVVQQNDLTDSVSFVQRQTGVAGTPGQPAGRQIKCQLSGVVCRYQSFVFDSLAVAAGRVPLSVPDSGTVWSLFIQPRQLCHANDT